MAPAASITVLSPTRAAHGALATKRFHVAPATPADEQHERRRGRPPARWAESTAGQRSTRMRVQPGGKSRTRTCAPSHLSVHTRVRRFPERLMSITSSIPQYPPSTVRVRPRTSGSAHPNVLVPGGAVAAEDVDGTGGVDHGRVVISAGPRRLVFHAIPAHTCGQRGRKADGQRENTRGRPPIAAEL
jgi:hypothetical protein